MTTKRRRLDDKAVCDVCGSNVNPAPAPTGILEPELSRKKPEASHSNEPPNHMHACSSKWSNVVGRSWLQGAWATTTTTHPHLSIPPPTSLKVV